MSRDGFFSRGEIREDLRDDGKVPVCKERFIMDRIVGVISGAILLRREVGMGSRSQNELEDVEIKVFISDRVAGVNKRSRGGGVGGGK